MISFNGILENYNNNKSINILNINFIFILLKLKLNFFKILKLNLLTFLNKYSQDTIFTVNKKIVEFGIIVSFLDKKF